MIIHLSLDNSNVNGKKKNKYEFTHIFLKIYKFELATIIIYLLQSKD